MVLASEKPILVTGAGGWVASHTIYQLLEAGYKVRGTVRDVAGKKYQFLKTFHPKAEANLELVSGDLLKPEGWDKAVEGCEYVLHVASPFSFNLSEKELVRPAVDGVTHVLAACCRNPDVKRVVQTSSVCSVVFGHPTERYACDKEAVEKARKAFNSELKRKMLVSASCEKAENPDLKSQDVPAKAADGLSTASGSNTPAVEENFDCKYRNSLRTSSATGKELAGWKLMCEEDWTVAENVTGYELSKVLAEKEAWKIMKEHKEKYPDSKLELTAICPGFVFGPIFCADQATGESSVHIASIMNKSYPNVPPLNSAHVDVRDVALAHIKAMEGESESVGNKRFICGADDGNLDFAEQSMILKDYYQCHGFSIATKVAPAFLLKLGSFFSKRIAVAAPKMSNMTYISNDKAHEDLGMNEWRPVCEALRAHALTMMAHGCLHKKKVPQDLIESYRPYN